MEEIVLFVKDSDLELAVHILHHNSLHFLLENCFLDIVARE